VRRFSVQFVLSRAGVSFVVVVENDAGCRAACSRISTISYSQAGTTPQSMLRRFAVATASRGVVTRWPTLLRAQCCRLQTTAPLFSTHQFNRRLLPGAANPTYESLQSGFQWNIPELFNIGDAICDSHVAEGRGAHTAIIYHESAARDAKRYTFALLAELSNRLANSLVAPRDVGGDGVARGDRVAILMPQRPEVAICHAAISKVGCVALPLFTLFAGEALQYRSVTRTQATTAACFRVTQMIALSACACLNIAHNASRHAFVRVTLMLVQVRLLSTLTQTHTNTHTNTQTHTQKRTHEHTTGSKTLRRQS
jgi:hypothetical protein